MQLVTFTESNNTRIGLLKDDGVIDLSAVRPGLPADMLGFIQAGDAAKAAAAEVASGDPQLRLAEVKLEAVINRPPKIIGIGLNYRAHAEESNMEIPKIPLVFTKQSTSANGPYDPVTSSRQGRPVAWDSLKNHRRH
jgi:2-keto-4-pentenoate hydratase/2-oxohepta-3-ene-1,7-dioic acid hydratase in catechol pathway